MVATQNFLAADLGASSGRAVVARFDGERMSLDEVHRFANGPIALPSAAGTSLYWDALRLFGEVKQGLANAVRCCDAGLVSLGIDTWGVDFGLLDRRGELLGNPYHYRDSRTDRMIDEACRRVPREEIFEATGIQFMQLNSLFQLLAMVDQGSPALPLAETLLMMPDLLNYWLTGRMASEYTIASTSQCMNMRTGDWATRLLERLGIPTRFLPSVIPPGTLLGSLLPAVASETGARSVAVVAPGTHDTASAVAAVPAEPRTASGPAGEGSDYAYLSSGTWSLMGVEIAQPVIDARTLAFNFTNEGGVCGTIRLLKNITGLWLIQECRRTWNQEGANLSWDDITGLAAAAPAFTAVLDVDARDFLPPGDMPARIQAYCRRTGQAAPEDKGTIARVVLESLALKYRLVLDMLDDLVGRRIGVLHIVGGGTQNRLLSQFAADAIGRPVVGGPVEATAAGNVLMQMLAVGAIGSLEEGRQVIRQSFATETFEPRPSARWDEAFARLRGLMS